MSTRQPQLVTDDLSELRAYLVKTGVLPVSGPEPLLQNLKRIHRCCYSLNYWRFKIRPRDAHRSTFLDELGSNALQIIPQALQGYRRTVKLLLRSLIEDALRHVYFWDHPIEYARLQGPERWYLQTEELIHYLTAHPHISQFTTAGKLQLEAKNFHRDLSAYVHGRSHKHLETRRAIADIECSPDQLAKHADDCEKATRICNFLLAVFHADRFSGWPQQERRVILCTLTKQQKQVLSQSITP